MSFRSLAEFGCDACRITADGAEVQSDLMQAVPPEGWTRLETNRRQGELAVLEVKYLCPGCLPRLRGVFVRRGDA
jgi:hypothetical protein